MTNGPNGPPRTPEDISAWLRDRVSRYLRQPAETIQVDSSLAAYGLDSVYGLALITEIEDVLGVQVESDLIWDLDTVNALTDYVVRYATDQVVTQATD